MECTNLLLFTKLEDFSSIKFLKKWTFFVFLTLTIYGVMSYTD